MEEKILLVEDDPALVDLLSYELDSLGYQFKIANDGTSGLNLAQTENPDLILLDVQLPGEMDGYQICEVLQKDDHTSGIPVIFITARGTLDDKLSGFAAGGTDYLTKPFTMAEFKARVKAVLHRRQVEQGRAQAVIDQYRKNLAQNMSHELLTPMSKVLGALDLISHIVPREDETDLGQLLNLAREGAYELHRLLEDLLLLNAITEETIKPFYQPLDLASVVQLSLDQVKTGYKPKNLHFQVDVASGNLIYILRKHAYNILSHLLDNACKFSPKRATISIFAEPVGVDGIKIYVKDEGPGIDQVYQSRIFDKFFQIDMSTTRMQHGLGVGLFIAQTIARHYGGEITVESRSGQGSTFCFYLPNHQTS